MNHPPPPAPCPSTRPYGWATGSQLAWWATRHQLQKPIIAVSTVTVHLITLRRWARDGWLVGYFTADASQLVHPEGGSWVLSEHHARRRGRGHGAQLRALVWPHLMDEADRHGTAIRMATKTPKLADQYRAEARGLVIDRVEAGVVHLMRAHRVPAEISCAYQECRSGTRLCHLG